MLFHKVFLAAAAVATAYAGPCKPVSSRASVSSSAVTGIPSSTASVEVSDTTLTATSASSGTEEATSTVTISSETVTSEGSTTLATLLSSSGSVSGGLSTSATGSQSGDVLVSTSGSEALGLSTGTAVTGTMTSGGITTGTTDVDLTTKPTTAPTTDGTTDAAATGTTTTELSGQATIDPATQSDATPGPSTTQHTTTEGTTTESTVTAPTSTSEFCYDNADVISMLAFDPVASPFCVSYLSMTMHTITEYATTDPTNVYQVDVATITADALTHIETDYDGVTAILTEFKTNTEWSEATVTSTRSVETITCLDTAYSYVAPVPTIDRGSPHPEKRGQDEIEVPEAIPSDWTEAQTSDICSCLDLEEPTTHTTVTQTVEPTTFITASTDVVTPIDEYTKVITTTAVSVFTSTVTEKKTSTVTAWVVETTFADNNDIAYRRLNCPFNANAYDDGFTTNYFKSKPVLSSGNAHTLQFSACSSLTLPSSGTFDASQSALLYNAYFYAKETGTYTFSVPDTIDNWGYLWVKDAAYTWSYGAWAIQGTRTGQNSALWKGGSY
ncbi:uncharacterized protein FFUJ_14421 [Fusarium fujikuroi IMI 58289]|uniref:GLEYA adhesin domain-containing protein n=1 Tax=Gibberella fujikuroi (strain CBS 195.34 / IMI 58289 / NRRL A-6831) TaxID=1279085 RepID=S0E9Z6_GIBF5|nr:uncharacterized protein FFUJ_14421 [Fusarium fujikuroi IMI 58289]KLO93704.1 uncharacterized protein LW94_9475 [Fusarium fujikuroi]CCT71704.1 uncharacterized protein FFUJ_14421 [Fusarium fujikuroi IMI 58289]SCO20518.1 uncharacterized protein FFM5_12425 [Fusarium fujikuroi]SCO51302.1 uncharacterized protein FFMR_10444 [Fusarium fujikuroi]